MELVISTLEKAFVDGISLLSRTRFHRNAPLYLLWPDRPLRVEYEHLSEPAHTIREMRVRITCDAWGERTNVILTVSRHMQSWKVYGPFSIFYGDDYPIVSLQGKVVNTKTIYPHSVTLRDAARPQEYRIRSRAR